MASVKITSMAALVAAVAATAAMPAHAYDVDGLPAAKRAERNWTQNGTSTGVRSTHTRQGDVSQGQDSSGSQNRTAGNDKVIVWRDEGDEGGYRWQRGPHRYNEGVEQREAARLREDHRERDGHGALRRFHRHDDDNASSYNTYEYRRHHHRHHWWAFWR